MPLEEAVDIKKIERRLAAAEINNDSLSVDLVDHICCMIEERLDLGLPWKRLKKQSSRKWARCN
jgi:hypothetical protein